VSDDVEQPAASSAEPTDAELLAEHVRGDPDAFATLVLRHRDRLWSLALRTTGNRDDAADAVQDALLSAHRNAAGFRSEAAVTTWLHRIVVNACLDRLRRQRTRPTVPWPESDLGVAPEQLTAPDAIGRHETRWEIERALQQLPDDQRAAVVLVDVEGFSVAEAAQLLDCPTGTVKSRCARGRAKLAPLLAHVRNPDHGTDVQRDSNRPHDPGARGD